MSGRTFIIVKLVGTDKSKFSAFFKLGNDKVFNQLTFADAGIQAAENAVVGKIRFGCLDVAFRRPVLIAVKLEC